MPHALEPTWMVVGKTGTQMPDALIAIGLTRSVLTCPAANVSTAPIPRPTLGAASTDAVVKSRLMMTPLSVWSASQSRTGIGAICCRVQCVTQPEAGQRRLPERTLEASDALDLHPSADARATKP